MPDQQEKKVKMKIFEFSYYDHKASVAPMSSTVVTKKVKAESFWITASGGCVFQKYSELGTLRGFYYIDNVIEVKPFTTAVDVE